MTKIIDFAAIGEHRAERDSYARLLAREVLHYLDSGISLDDRDGTDMLHTYADAFRGAEHQVHIDEEASLAYAEQLHDVVENRRILDGRSHESVSYGRG